MKIFGSAGASPSHNLIGESDGRVNLPVSLKSRCGEMNRFVALLNKIRRKRIGVG